MIHVHTFLVCSKKIERSLPSIALFFFIKKLSFWFVLCVITHSTGEGQKKKHVIKVTWHSLYKRFSHSLTHLVTTHTHTHTHTRRARIHDSNNKIKRCTRGVRGRKERRQNVGIFRENNNYSYHYKREKIRFTNLLIISLFTKTVCVNNTRKKFVFVFIDVL